MKNKKIKICHIAHQLTGKADGVFTHLKMLFELLDKNKYENILLYSADIEEVNNYLFSIGIKVYNIPELNKKLPLKLFFKVFRILKYEKVDIIQPHLVKPYIFAGILNLFLKKKVVYNYHGIFIENDFYNWFEKKLLKLLHNVITTFNLVEVVIVPSLGSKNKLELETSLFKKIIIYSNGYYQSPTTSSIDTDLINTFKKLKQESFLAGIIGRVDAGKRIDIALKILQKLKQEKINVYFLFVGDGDLIQEMKKVSEKLNVSDRCSFTGYIENIKYYFSYFDLILFTSESEGFPLVIWEAMFNEVPIVSSDVGGIREILEEESCGLVYKFGDILKCVEIIKELYNDEDKRKQLGKNGKKAIFEKYNENKFIKFFENLYDGLSNER